MRRNQIVGLVAALILVAVPAGAKHDERPGTSLDPWHHDGDTFTAEVGQP